MPIDVVVPPLGESSGGAKLASWLKREGDAVSAGETIAEIETDKTIVEVVAPADGTLDAIQVQAGSGDLADGQALAVIREGAAPAAKARPVPAPPSPQERSDRSPRQIHSTTNYQPPTTNSVAATPLAARMAAVLDLDLSAVPAAGAGGKISKADIDRFVAGGSALADRGSGGTLPTYVGRSPSSPRSRETDPAYEDRPLSPMRKVTAARMLQAKQTIPHFYLSTECRMDALIHQQAGANASASATSGRHATRQAALIGQTAPRSAPADKAVSTKLTLTDFIIRAVALAMREVPDANAAWVDEAVRVYERVDVAVAVNTPRGLITPVVRDAASKSLDQIAGEFRALTARARDGALTPPEYSGGTVTISNLGMFGVDSLFAILNPPQSCIIGIGAVEEKPVVRDGQIEIGSAMTCTLSADHRVLDGATGATLLRALKRALEQPTVL